MADNLTDTLKRIFDKGRVEYKIIRGSVIKVNLDELTCDVQPDTDDSAPILDVDVALGLEGFIGIPTPGSSVLVGMENASTGTLLVVSGLDEARVYADVVRIGAGDENSTSTLPKIEELVEKLNNLENAFNALLAHYKTHIHTSGSPGSPTTPLTVPPTQQNLQLTQKEDIENPNIIQS